MHAVAPIPTDGGKFFKCMMKINITQLKIKITPTAYYFDNTAQHFLAFVVQHICSWGERSLLETSTKNKKEVDEVDEVGLGEQGG